MHALNASLPVPASRRSTVERALTTIETGVLAALVGLVLVFTMTDAASILPALSFVSAQ